ncbi:MAG TPA: DUF3800 domain-containing protein [Bryobacteraceae bacterium]|nr:DUF3800 domain-containing protein [Bryobacteraceae bacterium]
MPTTWYFDGSGTGDDCRIMVLSGVGASDETWKAFDTAWSTARNELGLDVWHSTDYFRRIPAMKAEPPVSLLNIIGQQWSQEFNSVSFAADKAAVETIRNQFHDAVPPVERMLTDWCFRGIGVSKADTGHRDRARILFDRSEPFIRHLKSPWQAGRRELKRVKAGGWPLQIREIEPASNKDHPGLQAADLLSWLIRCRYEYGDKLIDSRVPVMMFPFMAAGRLRGGFLDQSTIRSLYIEKRTLELGHNYAFV